MENPAERQSLYLELLTESFDFLSKQFPKAHKAILSQFQEQLKNDHDLNANKYFGIYKLALTSKDTKLISSALDTIDKLINTGFLDGNCEESLISLDLDKKASDKSPKELRDPKRKLIDSIVDIVSACRKEREDSIQSQIINVLTIIATKLRNVVRGNNLQKILDNLFQIYATARSSQNQNSAKTSLKLIVTTVLQRVERNDQNQQDDRSKSKSKKSEFEISFTDIQNKTQRVSPDQTAHGITTVIEKGNESSEIKDITKDQEEIKRELTPSEEQKSEIPKEEAKEKENKEVNEREELYRSYISRNVTNLVDDVCLYFGKVDDVLKKYEGKDQSDNPIIQQEISEIPFKAIPLSTDLDEGKAKNFRKVKIGNEKNTPAGVFGWCFICRSSASLYCKDTKVPVCSLECKFKHLEQADFLNANQVDGYFHKNLEEVQDAYQVFGFLCKLSNKEAQGKESSSDVLKMKALALELLLAVMTNPNPIFSSRKEFRDSIREYLCTSVLKNSVSSDKVIFSYSLGLFNTLVNHFRDFLKPEMALFIDRIFLHMLESANSIYLHRMSALQVFNKICSKANIILDFYVNYDCDVESNNLVERMVELLCKIAQGKFARPEYSSMVQPAQDQNLRFVALGSLVNLVKGLVVFTEDYNKQMTAQRHELTKKVTSEETKEEEEKDKEAILEIENTKKEIFNQLDEIGKSRWFKNELQKAIQKFNFKIKLGMKLFTQLGVLNPNDAKSIARFFKKTPNLSHEKLGEYFGDEHEFNIKVLTEFSDLIDLRNKTLDEALRVYLKHFQLPGEGQKIDRVMQVFAGKFYKDNPTSFNSATVAYTLSFLFMMLQTDAHNPQVKPEDKMKLTSFIGLARGVNDGDNLSPEELTGYYNRIITNPLGLHEANRAKKAIADAQASTSTEREEKFKKESEKMIKEGQRIIKGAHNQQYHSVRNTDCIKPLFHEVVWSPVLAVFSVLLEQSEDTNMIQSCLDGFANCIIVTGLHNMSVERDTFVSSLAKFTNILIRREIKEKNIKCIKLLLDLASTRGSLLRTSWRYVLECIVWIDYYFHYFSFPNRGSESHGSKGGKSHHDSLEHIEAVNSEIIQQVVDLNVVNVIFSKSSTFNIEEVIDFITCLCQISSEELRGKGTNTYCLQKLVEVAHFNMEGIKFIWSRIWNIMGEHIRTIALDSSPEISLFAIDSLKQLSIKFLSQKEMGLLEFQKDFLKPFEIVFQKTKNSDMKELILGCCNYIIVSTRKDLKSGWKTIIDILGISADSEDPNLTKISFSITESILQQDVKSLHDLVSDFTILLLKFARSKKQEVADASLKYLKTFLQQSIEVDTNTEKEIETKEEQDQIDPNTTVIEEQASFPIILIHGLPEKTWISILTSIITLASDSEPKIQAQSTMFLFDLLEQYGSGFPQNFWGMVLSGVIKPLFDEIQYSFPAGVSPKSEKSEAFQKFYTRAYERLIDLFSMFFDKLNQFSAELANVILSCIQNENQIIEKVATEALKYMISKDVNLKLKALEIIHDIFTRLCSATPLAQALNLTENERQNRDTPEKELGYKELRREGGTLEFKEWKINPTEFESQCKAQLLLFTVVKESLESLLDGLDSQKTTKFREVIKAVLKFSRRFNEQIYLRYSLWKCGFSRANERGIPDLVELESEALAVYSFLIFEKLENQENCYQEFLEMGFELVAIFRTKNEKLLNLTKVEANKKTGAEGVGSENEGDEEFQKQENRIRKLSLEKEILSLRVLLFRDFLSKLEKINPDQIQGSIKSITKELIDGVVCFIPKESEYYTDILRNLLNKYFEFSFVKIDE